MGYHMVNGRYADVQDLVLKGSGLESASTNGAAIETGDRRVARLKLDITVDNGTSLDVVVQTSRDGVTWYTSGAFTQQAGVASEQKLFLLDRFVRYSSTIVGTSFTYSVSGETV